jgi:glycosyltransferase involved in cell wall biosynthesis
MDICTIVAKNYVAFARVLAKSYKRQHPEGRCFALVIDEVDGYLDPAAEPFELVTPDQIGLDRFADMAARYDVLELSTAVKPWLLRHLMHDRGIEKLAYLDPDIEVLASLREIDDLLDENDIVLIPHLTEPIPRDGYKPSEADILIAGSYNLGFLGLARRPAVEELLDWWSERLAEECVVAPERGVFVDQRWMDFAPGFLERAALLRDPGYDVAYWNLHSRPIAREGERWTAAGSTLRFMHYSGFDPSQPGKLSKHQNRIQLSPGEPLARLCGRYAEALLAEGHEQAKDWPYTYATLPDGMRLDRVTRAAYVTAAEEGAVKHSIFERQGAEELLDWLTSPASVGAGHGVNRYLEALHKVRPGLAEAYPDLSGRGGVELVAWARVYGRSELSIPDALLPGFGSGGAVGARGVNVVGYFDAVLGVGEAARQMIGALEAEGIETATIGMTASGSPREQALGRETVTPRFPVNLVCVNADMVPAFAQQVGPGFFDERYSIGYWWWEVSRFPDRWLGSFRYLDEVWAGSRHVADALSEVATVPVLRVPPPVEVAVPPSLSREQLGLPEGFLFLFVFDYASVFERKNPLAVVEAFRRAFPEHGEAQLALKCINHDGYPAHHERLLAAAAERPDVHVLARTVSRAEKDAMVASCDCFVSLHRSEGFGFTLAEAMWLGKPVIGTGYSGNLDYMRPDNSYLVDYRLVPIGLGAEPYPADGVWAEPDLDHAAQLMREVRADPAAAAARAARGQAELRASHSKQAVGAAIAKRLEVIDRSGARTSRSTPALVHGELAKTSHRIRTGPVAPPRQRFGGLQRFLRRLVLRLIKPFTVHERIVDEELVRAVAALGDGLAGAHLRIDDLARRQAQPRKAGDGGSGGEARGEAGLEPLGDAGGLAVEEPQAEGEDQGDQRKRDEQPLPAADVHGGTVDRR